MKLPRCQTNSILSSEKSKLSPDLLKHVPKTVYLWLANSLELFYELTPEATVKK
jgi:hypothetical protein